VRRYSRAQESLCVTFDVEPWDGVSLRRCVDSAAVASRDNVHMVSEPLEVADEVSRANRGGLRRRRVVRRDYEHASTLMMALFHDGAPAE
jgi:hypothetical protein